ncbi:MAG: hypothetical protein IPK48_00350 [Gammaproteobacteria bacterium]|nr:hypothetical protein [Gammaproteobacteria bacterium]
MFHRLSHAVLLAVAFLFTTAVEAAPSSGRGQRLARLAGLVYRQGRGFQKYDADVELVRFPNYTDSIQALSASQLDANSQTWGDTMAPLAAGVPLKIILANDNSAGNVALMVAPSITGFADLKASRSPLNNRVFPNHGG